eukprot:TRINITY_DN19887_c0_g1_i10.p1 TRINITY_DN19887_c0_g1~~TRINITY_DN19887_c0_g1_i10.p1  ORF type:complete len:293 (-),score=95.74 TRINITY_DN19887_c0_g1_i10:299-1177(-)
MATLDDKLLGEKLHYYCSSSEDEDGDEGGRIQDAPPSNIPQPPVNDGPNTGPKGVIKDWQRYKQLESEKRAEAEVEKLALAKKLNLSCKSSREEAEEKEREQKLEEEMDELLNDAFMQEYMQKRLEEMMKTVLPTKKFGHVINLESDLHFLNAIDNEEKACTVMILIHEDEVAGCAAMRGCLTCLAKDYPTVKFCQIYSSIAGLSKHFKVSGVPALLVYRGGQLISSFVQLTNQLGEDFYAPELESFLHEYALLPNQEEMPKLIRGPAPSTTAAPSGGGSSRRRDSDEDDSD